MQRGKTRKEIEKEIKNREDRKWKEHLKLRKKMEDEINRSDEAHKRKQRKDR